MEVPYKHDIALHNLISPERLIPIFTKVLKPSSVVDFGCGIGTFLRVFKDNGVEHILGLDGEWVDKSLLSQNIDSSFFIETNLNDPIVLEKKFDLAICLEVVEHLRPESADSIVHSLTQASDIIVFSAAIPGQGGQNHINEQWPDYWAQKFLAEGYVMLDVLRSSIWNDSDIFWWYRQNIFIVVRQDMATEVQNQFAHILPQDKLLSMIHPELFTNVIKQRNLIQSEYNQLCDGRCGIRLYLKLLLKSVKRFIVGHLKYSKRP